VNCPSCGFENPAGFKFCGECASPLAGGREPSADRHPRDYTPKHLAEKILQSKSALEGERKQVTVLFADVKGSMELAEGIDPEEWHRILDRFFQILADGVHRFEGTVNQYTGDGIMALFGAPIAHEDHAQRACYAGLHLRDELRRYADELRLDRGLNFSVRTGLNSGEVVVGKIGDDLRMDYTAQGPTVGLAARMQQIAEAGRIWLTERTARLVTGYFRLRDLGPLDVKGAREPVRVYDLEGLGPHVTRLDVSRARGFTRFVGRGREMQILETTLARAVDGRGQIVGVVGEAGIGKSRLCLEFVKHCRDQGISVWEAHCPAHGRAIPLLPVLELMRAFFGIGERDDPAEARRKIAGTLVLLDERLREDLPLAFDFLRVPDPDHALPNLDPEARRRRLLAFTRRLFEARSAREPAVFLMDDLHWIDAESDAFIAQLIESVVATRTLLLTNFRPEYQAPWMGRSDYHQLPLLPLGSEASDELLRELLGQDPALHALRERIRERADGNPFFTEELVHSLVEGGGLEGERGAYRLAGDVADLMLPPTVHSVLAARIDRLSQPEKAVLQVASVIGREFAEPVLRQVTAFSESELAAVLDALRRAEFVYETALYPVAEYRFKHPLTEEVAYRSQLGERRARLHAAVARAIEETERERLDERAALLAHHWEAADEPGEAARWHRRAAEWADSRDSAVALRHWRRVRELLAQLSESTETLALRKEACSQILFTFWRVRTPEEDEWDAVYQEGRELAQKSGDQHTLARLLSGLAGLRGFAGEHHAQVELLQEALGLAEACGDFALEASLHQRLGWAHGLAGNNREQLAWTERGLAFCGGDGRRAGRLSGFDTYVWLVAQRGRALAHRGRLAEAQEVLERALALAREEEDYWALGYAHEGCVTLAWVRGDLAAMRDHAVKGIEAIERSGIIPAIPFLALGNASTESGEWSAAVDACEQGLAGFAGGALRVETYYAVMCLTLSRAALGLGEPDRARETVGEVRELIRGLPELRTSFPDLQLGFAQALLDLDGATARREIEDALEGVLAAARERGWEAYEPFALVERARLARLLGDEPTRERHLLEAQRLFTALGAPLRAERLATELSL
jgi:class 3 adenylate cyclase/tetratricopeptide (TPR) repeat protein